MYDERIKTAAMMHYHHLYPRSNFFALSFERQREYFKAMEVAISSYHNSTQKRNLDSNISTMGDRNVQ